MDTQKLNDEVIRLSTVVDGLMSWRRDAMTILGNIQSKQETIDDKVGENSTKLSLLEKAVDLMEETRRLLKKAFIFPVITGIIVGAAVVAMNYFILKPPVP